MKTFLLIVIVFLLYTSPQARDATANVLRTTANFLDTKPQESSNPEHFQIPNPFHQ